MLIEDFLNSIDIVYCKDMTKTLERYHNGQNVSYDIVVQSGKVVNKRDHYFPHIIMPYSKVEMKTRREYRKWACFGKNKYEYYTDLPLNYFPTGLSRDDLILTSETDDEIRCRAYLIQSDILKKVMWGPLQFNGGTHIVWGGSVGRNSGKRPENDFYYEDTP